MITACLSTLSLHRLLLLHLLESLHVLFELFGLMHVIFLLVAIRVPTGAETDLITLVLASYPVEL